MVLHRSITVLAFLSFCAALTSAQVTLKGAYTTTGPSSSCTPGPISSSFVTTDLKAWLYVSVANAVPGDNLEADFIRPDGKLYASLPFNPVTQAGDQCFDVYMVIGGTAAASLTGTWTVRGYWNGLPLFSITFTIAPPGSNGGGGPTGINLLKNSGGDLTPGDSTCGASMFIQSWSIDSPGVSLCKYGSAEISPGDPGPPDRGTNYFAGGPATSFSSMSQHVDVSVYANQIDSGFLPYVFSGWLGGVDGQTDNVGVTLSFRDASNNMLGVSSLAPVFPVDRNNATGLVLKSANGLVPRGTRGVYVVLQFNRVSGIYNHAAADSLSLVFGAPDTGGGCSSGINPLTNSVGASGGSATVLITTGAGCGWTATSNVSWITIASGLNGIGNGSLNYQVAANTSASPRTGTIAIARQTHTVTQSAGCVYTLLSASSMASAAGTSGSVQVATSNFCAWIATSSAPWITVASGASGTGFGGVKYIVAPNSSGGVRTGTLVIGGQTFVVNQPAAPGLFPAISSGGIVNAASFIPANRSPGAIAQGSFFSIFGANLGPDPSQAQKSYPLQTVFGGVSLAVTQGNTSVNAYPVFVSPGQINAIMPSNAPTGEVQITVTYNGVNGAAAPARVSIANFGIFTTASGKGQGIIQNYVSASQLPLNTQAVPATPGQTGILLGTGLGAISGPDNQTPPVGDLAGNIRIVIGGKTAVSLYAGRMPGVAGVDQINFQVPPDVPMGCYVPVQVQAGTTYSNTVSMSISARGEPCTDPQNPLVSVTARGGKIGSVLLTRADIPAPPQADQARLPVKIDLGTATFADTTGLGSLGNMFLTSPPLGTCSTLSGGLDFASLLGSGSGSPIGTVGRNALGQNLDAGPAIVISGVVALKPLDSSNPSSPYAGILGSSTPGLTDLPLLLDPGTISITGSGGKDAGAFRTSAAMGEGVVWSNRGQISQIDRSAPLIINWSGGDASKLVLIAGSSTDQTTNTAVGFFCLAPSAPGLFSIPISMLANLPSTLANADATGVLMVATIASGSYSTFQASGLDAGFVFAVNLTEISVGIQ